LNHDSVTREGQETAALYALGALSQHEALAFERHLSEGCQFCLAELEQFNQVVGALGTATTPVAPPEYLCDVLAARIERESLEASPASAMVLPFPGKTITIQRKSAPSPFSRTPFAWIAAAALLIAFAYTFMSWRSERQKLLSSLDQQETQRLKASDENVKLKEQLRKETGLSTELTLINAVLRSPQWRLIALDGQPPAPDSAAKVYWDVQGSRWVVSAELPPAPEGKVYQLWFVTASRNVSAGLIRPDKSGHGFTVVQLPSNITQLQAAAITLEPEGGSQQPTMPIYALGKAG
jgi:anti-sigma-K factor RskA